MKWILPVTIAVLAVFTNGDVTAQGNPTPPCRARTLDLRALDLRPDLTNSLICKNSISGLEYEGYPGPGSEEIAIFTQYLNGYVKLNHIWNCDEAYLSYIGDQPFLIFDTMENCRFDMIRITGGAMTSLSGGHGATSSGDDYAAQNMLRGSPGIIDISDDISQVDLANNFEGSWPWVNFGENNLYFPTVGPENMAIYANLSSGTLDIGAIDNNFWGIGVAPPSSGSCALYCNWNSANPTYINAYKINFTCASSLTDSSNFSGVECEGSLGFKAKGKGATPQAVDSLTSCRRELNQGISYESNFQDQMAYDTLQAYVDTCYNDALSYEAFGTMTNAEYQLKLKDSTIEMKYRLWLESVLYLNTTNPEYFCQCVQALGSTFDLPNSGFAVLQWLILNTPCDTPYLWQEYEDGRQSQYETWQTTNPGQPLDTTLPSLQQLGIDTLLARHLLAVVSNQPVNIILNATASPNPVSIGTEITFGISQEAYVKIGLFDILGHEVTSPGYEGLFEAGNHEVPLSLQSLPSGTYFARILTAYGSVATVKLVKE